MFARLDPQVRLAQLSRRIVQTRVFLAQQVAKQEAMERANLDVTDQAAFVHLLQKGLSLTERHREMIMATLDSQSKR